MLNTPLTTPPVANPLGEKPFIIELHQLDKTHGGYFRPAACLKLSPIFRASGLLLTLPAEELKNLLFLLTFVTPNGECQATVQQLSAAMRLSEAKVRTRMKRLCAFRWHSEALVLEIKRESGLDGYTVAPQLVAFERVVAPAIEEQPASTESSGGSRDAVIAFSREQYGRPRTAVERMMARQMGWDMPEASSDQAQPYNAEAPSAAASDSHSAIQIKRRLENEGVTGDQAQSLLDAYPLQRIERQLSWLPYRKAKNPPGFLIAAVENDYEEPKMLRIKKTFDQTNAEPTPTSGSSSNQDSL